MKNYIIIFIFSICTIYASNKKTSEWNIQITDDPFSDTKRVFMSLPSDSGEQTLCIRCENGKTTDLWINWNTDLRLQYDDSKFNTDYNITVKHRVGKKKKSYEYSWSISTDNQSTFYPVETGNGSAMAVAIG